MTLVIYIPYNDGSILISDRQNTYSSDLTREPIDKILELSNFSTVLGFAGPTQKCRYLIDRLERVEGNSNFLETYSSIYRECYGFPELGFRGSGEIEFLVVSNEDDDASNYVVYKIVDALAYRANRTKCAAIGNGSKFISPQLELDTSSITFEDAETFGLEIISYVSKMDISVGNPVDMGYNVCNITSEINQVLTLTPKSVDITKLLYRFD